MAVVAAAAESGGGVCEEEKAEREAGDGVRRMERRGRLILRVLERDDAMW